MKKLLLALSLALFFPTIASAQCTGVFGPGTVCGNSGGTSIVPHTFPLSSFSASFPSYTFPDGATWTTGGITVPLNGNLVVTGNASVSGSPNIVLSSVFGGANTGGGLLFNALNGSSQSKTFAFINCGSGAVITAGSEQGLCDYSVLGPSSTNQIITQASLGASSGCFLCNGNSDNFWSSGTATARWSNVYSFNLNLYGSAALAPATGTAAWITNNVDGTHNAEITFQNAGTEKWEIGSNSANTFFVFDTAAGTNALTIGNNGGAITANRVLSAADGQSGSINNPTVSLNLGSYGQTGNNCVSHLALFGTTYGFGVGNAGVVNECSGGTFAFFANSNGLNTTPSLVVGAGVAIGSVTDPGAGNTLTTSIAMIGSTDTGISRDSAGVIDFGNGTAQTSNATLQMSSFTLQGTPQFTNFSTGASTQTFTNSPCSALTTERWIKVKIVGSTSQFFVPACS